MTTVQNFGSLEYVLDKFSQTWSWKITGSRAVNMISRLVPQAWYGENIDEVIVPDNPENVKQIKLILDRYPLEILSKSAWQRKFSKMLLVYHITFCKHPFPKYTRVLNILEF